MADNERTIHISIRTTPSQKDRWARASEKTGQSISDAARNALDWWAASVLKNDSD